MTAPRPAAIVIALLLAGCSPGPDGGADGGTAEPTSSDASPPASAASTPTAEPSPDVGAPQPSPAPELEQPAVWPSADVDLDDPVAAAADFVSTVLGVEPNLGEFRRGDSRSGEVEVRTPTEAGDGRMVRSTLLLRQLGPDGAWFVIGAISGVNTITTPQAAATVPAGAVDVSGEGRGFEGTLNVEAWLPGGVEPLDLAVAAGGAFADPEPYTVTLDLSDAAEGDTVLLLVRGGVGLESDPGEFAAIPVVVG